MFFYLEKQLENNIIRCDIYSQFTGFHSHTNYYQNWKSKANLIFFSPLVYKGSAKPSLTGIQTYEGHIFTITAFYFSCS